MALNNDPNRPLRFALPKGRLLLKTLGAMREANIHIPDTVINTRKLILDVSEYTVDLLGCGLELLLLKNSDVPVYVEHGVADIGVVGTDALYEADVHVYRPFTFPFGSCAISIAAPRGVTRDELYKRPNLRIATKYRRYARDHFTAQGLVTEIIPLSGSVELAPVLGLADAILDLVESGQTIRDNNLVIIETIEKTYVKLITNATIGSERMVFIDRLIQLFAQTQPPPTP